jgi:hypothetical protein
VGAGVGVGLGTGVGVGFGALESVVPFKAHPAIANGQATKATKKMLRTFAGSAIGFSFFYPHPRGARAFSDLLASECNFCSCMSSHSLDHEPTVGPLLDF